MSDNVIVATIKYILLEVLWDIIYFPIWWYSKGLKGVIRYCFNSGAFHLQRRVALGIWLKNMLKPMYGDYTKEGRIISFFMRVVVLIWKLLSAFVWIFILFILFILWLALPLVFVYYILYQVFDVPFFTFS